MHIFCSQGCECHFGIDCCCLGSVFIGPVVGFLRVMISKFRLHDLSIGAKAVIKRPESSDGASSCGFTNFSLSCAKSNLLSLSQQAVCHVSGGQKTTTQNQVAKLLKLLEITGSCRINSSYHFYFQNFICI